METPVESRTWQKWLQEEISVIRLISFGYFEPDREITAVVLADTLRAFEEYVGPDLSADSCAAVAAEADENADAYLIGVASLWIFLRLSDSRHAMSREQLHSIVKAGGGAMLTVNTATREGGWQFKLYEMPRWPAVVAPYRATRFDRRRRFR